MKQFFFLSVILLSGSSLVFAQDQTENVDPVFGTPPPTSRDPFTQSRGIVGTKPPTGLTDTSTGIQSNPIDGGLSILLGAGALYGARRYKMAKTKAKANAQY